MAANRKESDMRRNNDEDRRINKIMLTMALAACIVSAGILYAGHVAVEKRTAMYEQLLQQNHAVTYAR